MVYKFVKKSNLEYYFENPEEMNNLLPTGPSISSLNINWNYRWEETGRERKETTSPVILESLPFALPG